jgi:GAF domain-containing protein
VARTPANVGQQISSLFDRRAWRFKWASRFVKASFVAVGALIAGVAQFLQIPPGQSPTTAQVIGIAATVVVFLGSIFVMIIDEDASEELAAARRAQEEFRELIDELDALPDYEAAIDRQIYLYQSMSVMRSTLERSVVSGDDLLGTVKLMVELTERLLPVALGFKQSDRWTICVYQAEATGTGRDRLVCVAHHRAIRCDVSEARCWDEGVGVAGIAYANRQEVVVPDMQAAGLGSVFNIAAGARDYDEDRYRSIAAVPVRVDGRDKPWGVVVATNDRYGHFSLEEDLGAQTVEGVRLLAGMVALAATVCKSKRVESGPRPPTSARETIQEPLRTGGANGDHG